MFYDIIDLFLGSIFKVFFLKKGEKSSNFAVKEKIVAYRAMVILGFTAKLPRIDCRPFFIGEIMKKRLQKKSVKNELIEVRKLMCIKREKELEELKKLRELLIEKNMLLDDLNRRK